MEASIMDQAHYLLESLRSFWAEISIALPRIIGAILLLTIGWMIAKVIRKATIRVLRLVKVDVLAEKSGIEDFLLRGGVKYTTVTILANLIYWSIMFTVTLAVLNSLGLQAAAELFNKIILYIPNVFVAVLVLIFGTLFAKLFRGIAYTWLNNVGIGGAEVVSSIAQYAILIFVVSVALEQLSIGGQILVSAFQLAFGALCLALALAFGLGGRDWAAQILEKFRK
jgi:Mechanosensitive ion channel, conserved TM helix